MWFRWKTPDVDPSKTMEFMNRFASDDNLREELTEEPLELPDGSRYSSIRYQGLFSTKFQLETFPFDTQALIAVMEDTLTGAADQIHVPDGEEPVKINPVITLPGFSVGAPTLRVATNTRRLPRLSPTRRSNPRADGGGSPLSDRVRSR